jgi:hypothetical protein
VILALVRVVRTLAVPALLFADATVAAATEAVIAGVGGCALGLPLLGGAAGFTCGLDFAAELAEAPVLAGVALAAVVFVVAGLPAVVFADGVWADEAVFPVGAFVGSEVFGPPLLERYFFGCVADFFFAAAFFADPAGLVVAGSIASDSAAAAATRTPILSTRVTIQYRDSETRHSWRVSASILRRSRIPGILHTGSLRLAHPSHLFFQLTDLIFVIPVPQSPIQQLPYNLRTTGHRMDVVGAHQPGLGRIPARHGAFSAHGLKCIEERRSGLRRDPRLDLYQVR